MAKKLVGFWLIERKICVFRKKNIVFGGGFKVENMAEATTASFFKKRSPRTRSRLSYSSASEDDGGGKTPLAVPEGLRGLLNDVSREVGIEFFFNGFYVKMLHDFKKIVLKQTSNFSW